MAWFTRIRTLYLLALFQLVAGPLVLFQVAVLCKLTVREVPRHGMASALSMAWQHPEFQAVLAPEVRADALKSKSPLPVEDPKADAVKAKMPPVPWESAALVLMNPAERVGWRDPGEAWAPALPLPPPGPPPRLG